MMNTTSVKKMYDVHTIWIVMLLLTLSTYVLGRLDFNGLAVVLILLVTAIIKAVFIIRDFMELRGVSLLWRVIMYGWLWVICIAILITYIISL
ncbi:MAG: hypothetical protein COA54_10620 [Thiotrichaceae bacterium]|nr:MAG: hypothetical protein COA54_10620 [Thiotrichaceae bacterium]